MIMIMLVKNLLETKYVGLKYTNYLNQKEFKRLCLNI